VLEQIGAAASWHSSCLVTSMLLHSDNLVAVLRAAQLRRCELDYGVVTAETFLQLQQRSPHLQLELRDAAMLVDDLQLAAVGKHCPQLLASGHCCFKSITHYGFMRAAVTTGPSLVGLCSARNACQGADPDGSYPETTAVPVQADDSSILVLAQHCPNLTKLQLESTSQAFTKQSILHIAAHLPSLRVLELLGCTGLDASCLFALVGGCHWLSHLSLDGPSGVAEVAICVPLLMLPQLDSVSLKDADQFTITALHSLLCCSQTLRHVHLPSGAPVWHAAFKHMAQEQLDAWGACRIARAWVGMNVYVARFW
jgi:hypothetical protein